MPSSEGLELDGDIVFRPVGEEGVVVDQRSSSVLVVNPVALRVLQLLRERLPIAAITTRLADEFDAEPQRIAADVEQFLDELRQRSMLH